MSCTACDDRGFYLGAGNAVVVCFSCSAGPRLYALLEALGRGEPVMYEHATDHPLAHAPIRHGRGSRSAIRIEPIKE